MASICNFFKPLKREKEVTPDPDPEPEDQNPKLDVTVETTSEPANEEYYALDEIITYEINIQNSGNIAISDITVNVQVNNVNQEPIHINGLGVGETTTNQVEYTVTEEDILAYEITLSATATGNTSSGTVSSSNSVTNYPEDPSGHLTVTGQTTSEPANGDGYALGEEIVYEVYAVNDRNLTISNITLTCEMTGDEWTFESLAPGESTEHRVISYEVIEDDILAGEVVTVVTATGESPDPDNPDVPVDPAEIPEPTEEIKPHIDVEFSHEDGEYSEGSSVSVNMTMANDGNVTISDISWEEELSGISFDSITLQPGQSNIYTLDYTLLSDDISSGSITFNLVINGTYGADEDVYSEDDYSYTINFN